MTVYSQGVQGSNIHIQTSFGLRAGKKTSLLEDTAAKFEVCNSTESHGEKYVTSFLM